MIGSPSNLELLLHSYYSPEPHPRHDAPAIKEGREYLFKHGMIDREDHLCHTTPKGEAFIKHLLTIPFPVAVWTVPENTNG